MIKKWNGSSFVNITPKKWNGSNWVNVDVYKWDGSKWTSMTAQQYTTTFDSTWSQSYKSNNAMRTDYRGRKLCQGDSGEDSYNIQRSLCGFGNIGSVLNGAIIQDVKLFLHADHFWYYAGGTALIGYHNHASKPSTFSHSTYGAAKQQFTSRDDMRWIDLPNKFAEGIRDGRYKGFSIYADSTAKSYYGVWHGANDGAHNKPKLKITYTK